MKGSVGGNSFQGSRYGQLVRQRVTPVDPATTRQGELRQFLADANVSWKGATSGQRDDWDNYAANTPWTNAFGDEVFLTGRLQYIRSAVFNQAGGQAINNAAPASPGLPANPDFTLTGDTLNGLQVDDFDNGGGVFDFMGFYWSAPQAETRNFFKGPFVDSQFFTSDEAAPVTLIASGLVLVGQKYFVGVRYRDTQQRLAGQLLIKSVVIT